MIIPDGIPLPPQSCLVGIVVPDPEVMPGWAKKKGMDGSYRDLCKNTVGAVLVHKKANAFKLCLECC